MQVQAGVADHREEQRRERDRCEQRPLLPQADKAVLNQVARQVVVLRKADGIAAQTRIEALEQLFKSTFVPVFQGFEDLAVVAEFHGRERSGPVCGTYRPENKYKPACRIFQTFSTIKHAIRCIKTFKNVLLSNPMKSLW